jgi:MFS family permease
MMIVSMVLMAVVTSAVATLPTYAQAGYLGYVIFMIIRGIVGIAFGGDYTAGFSFAVEWSPKKWRGMMGGLAMGGCGAGGLVATVATGLLLAYVGNDAMVAYGWRYVFLSALIPFVAVLVARLAITETPLFQFMKSAGKIEKSPLRTLVSKGTRYRFLQSVMFTIGLSGSTALTVSYFGPMLVNPPSVLSIGQQLTALQLLYLGYIFGAVLFGGHLSTIIGRRRLLLIGMPIYAITILPILFITITFARAANLVAVYSLAFVLGILVEYAFGVAPAYLNERFGTGHRASGQGLAYSIGHMLSGALVLSFPLLHSAFASIELSNFWFTAGLTGIIFSSIGAIAAYLGPETARLDLDKIETKMEID